MVHINTLCGQIMGLLNVTAGGACHCQWTSGEYPSGACNASKKILKFLSILHRKFYVTDTNRYVLFKGKNIRKGNTESHSQSFVSFIACFGFKLM
jgi:hypothetical protein